MSLPFQLSSHIDQALRRSAGNLGLTDRGFEPEVRFPAAVAQTFEWFQAERIAEKQSFDFSFEDELLRLVREREGR